MNLFLFKQNTKGLSGYGKGCLPGPVGLHPDHAFFKKDEKSKKNPISKNKTTKSNKVEIFNSNCNYVGSLLNGTSQIRIIDIEILESTMIDNLGKVFSLPLSKKQIEKCSEELLNYSEDLQVEEQSTYLTGKNGLYKKAIDSNTEQSAYVIVEYTGKKYKLQFEDGIIISSTPTTVDTGLGCQKVFDKYYKRTHPKDGTKQVIATIHTHYVKNKKIVYGVSTNCEKREHCDQKSAKKDNIVIYAIDDKSIHKIDPVGNKKTLSRNIDVLTDALYTYGRLDQRLFIESCKNKRDR